VISSRILVRAGLAGLLFFLPFGIAGQQIALGIGLLGVLASSEARGRARSYLLGARDGRALLLGVAAWVAASLLALLLSERAGEGVRELRKLLLLPALVLPVAGIEKRRDLLAAAIVLLAAATAAAAIGLVEHARGGGNHPSRLDGPIGFYMTTAGVLLPIALVALAAAVSCRSRIAAVVFALLASALLLTYTRGAWFAFAAGIAVLLARRRPLLLLPGFLLLVAVIAGVPSLRERLLTSWDAEHPLNRERVFLWDAGRRLFLDHPWRGAGLHDLGETIRAHRPPEAREPLTHFHNLYLQTAVATGVPGLLALAAFFFGFLRALLSAARRAPPELPRALAEGALASVAAFLVHGLFEWNLGDSEVALTLYAIIGMGIAAGRLVNREV